MLMTLFVSENILGEIVQLDADQSRHLSQVLRLRAGDRVMVTDGLGMMCFCDVVDPNPKAALVKVTDRHERWKERGYNLCVAVAPTKNIDRYEWFLEKATEIGIDKIMPLLCKHSERKIVRRERAEKVVLSAVKQSLKAYMPVVEEMTPFEVFLESLPDDVDGRFIAHCDEIEEKVELKDAVSKGGKNVILIGPEGDFSDEEVAMARSCGFKSVSLGRERLRTETAALYATTLFAIENI